MAKPLLDDDLRILIAPLLPTRPPRRFKHPGAQTRRQPACAERYPVRAQEGHSLGDAASEFGCCGITCWRRLRDWQQAGVWEQLHATLLSELRRREQLNLSRAVIDSSPVRAVFWGGNWTESDGSPQHRLQAPCDHRCAGYPAGLDRHRRQCPRCDAAAALD
jgi:transposase